MAMKLGRLVTTDRLVAPRGGSYAKLVPLTNKDTGETSRAEAVAVLLSKRVLHEPAALIEIYQCAQQGKIMIPICLVGHGYDYKEANDHLVNLESGLSACKLTELKERLHILSSTPGNTTVSVIALQAVLLSTLPRIIAVNWEPKGGKNQLDATVTNVLARLNARTSTAKLQTTQVKKSTLRASIRLVKLAEAAHATRSTRSSNGEEVEATSTAVTTV